MMNCMKKLKLNGKFNNLCVLKKMENIVASWQFRAFQILVKVPKFKIRNGLDIFNRGSKSGFILKSMVR